MIFIERQLLKKKSVPGACIHTIIMVYYTRHDIHYVQCIQYLLIGAIHSIQFRSPTRTRTHYSCNNNNVQAYSEKSSTKLQHLCGIMSSNGKTDHEYELEILGLYDSESASIHIVQISNISIVTV